MMGQQVSQGFTGHRAGLARLNAQALQDVRLEMFTDFMGDCPLMTLLGRLRAQENLFLLPRSLRATALGLPAIQADHHSQMFLAHDDVVDFCALEVFAHGRSSTWPDASSVSKPTADLKVRCRSVSRRPIHLRRDRSAEFREHLSGILKVVKIDNLDGTVHISVGDPDKRCRHAVTTQLDGIGVGARGARHTAYLYGDLFRLCSRLKALEDARIDVRTAK